MDKLLTNLKAIYFDVYKSYGGTESTFELLLDVVKRRKEERSLELTTLDQRPDDWYLNEKMIGMMLYVDLFSNDLKSLPTKIGYLKELGITFVHLMPLLKPREGENDGGYAVQDYLDIDPKLGDLKDFIHVLDEFRHAGIDVCIDYVLNHTADTHEWSMKAKQGHKSYQEMYIMYDSRDIPDLFDQTVPEVLPDKVPGNFTYNKEMMKGVFTSFSDFQWDLNFKNPDVFKEMIDILLHLANYGVNIIRLDAIAFMWKEQGTDCRNLEVVHKLLKMMHLIKEMVCPSLVLLGEAIVQPEEIIKYFGSDGDIECGLLYNANFMVNIFNSFATRETDLMKIDNMNLSIPNHGCFMNYIRCHDDIGWGLNDEGLKELNIDPHNHKIFLNEFYSGSFKGSFSKGAIYQYNPVNHDARINGTLASLLGLEKALIESDIPGVEYAINRIMLAHGMIIAQSGIPLIYSGDELATTNDHTYLDDDHKIDDGRWMHRAVFDWEKSLKRYDDHTNEAKVFQGIKKLIKIRTSEPLFNGRLDSKVVEINNNHLYVMVKKSDDDHLICFFNFSENHQYIKTRYINNEGYNGHYKDLITGKVIDFTEDEMHMYPYEFLWLKMM